MPGYLSQDTQASCPAQLPALASQPPSTPTSSAFSDQTIEEVLGKAIEAGSAALLRGDAAVKIEEAIDGTGCRVLGNVLWQFTYAGIIKNFV